LLLRFAPALLSVFAPLEKEKDGNPDRNDKLFSIFLHFHMSLYISSALSDFVKNGGITGNDDNARHQKSKNH
jgi:hypothetical protein